MNRRQLLAATGLTLTATLAGCYGLDPRDDSGDDGDPGGDRDDGEAGDDGANGDDGGTEATDDGQASTHSLFVENLDDEARRLDVDVTDREDEGPLIEGTYEVPDERGIEFRRELEWGRSFDVTVTLESGVSDTFEWAIESCPGARAEDGGSEQQGGSRNGSVRIEPDAEELSFVTDVCDEIVAGTEVAVGPAENYEVEDSG